MKLVFYTLTSVLLIFLPACRHKSNTAIEKILPQYEVLDNQDTINYLDINGLRQGKWIIYEVGSSNVNLSATCPDSTTNIKQYACPSGRCIQEEGFYKDDKKTGTWKHYNNDGTVRDSTVCSL